MKIYSMIFCLKREGIFLPGAERFCLEGAKYQSKIICFVSPSSLSVFLKLSTIQLILIIIIFHWKSIKNFWPYVRGKRNKWKSFWRGNGGTTFSIGWRSSNCFIRFFNFRRDWRRDRPFTATKRRTLVSDSQSEMSVTWTKTATMVRSLVNLPWWKIGLQV